MASRVQSGLRLGLGKQVSVVITVPSPSTEMPPPSAINREANRRTPAISAATAPKAASLSKGWYLPPQALKRNVVAARLPSGWVTNTGPASRAQLSSMAVSNRSMLASSMARASA